MAEPEAAPAADHGRLLVVDDEPFLREAVAASLTFLGFQVTTADTGAEALRLARERPFDLVVLDVMLPDTDGFEVVRRLRRDGSRLPVIFLTARDTQDDKVTGLTLGGDDYMTKQFGLEELAADPHRACAAPARRGGRAGAHLAGRIELTRTPTRSAGLTSRSSCRRPSSGCSATAAQPAGCWPARSCWTTCGTTISAGPARWSPPTSPTCAASWPPAGPM